MAITRENMAEATLKQRMDAMYKRDRIWGITFVIVLWAVYLFTFFTISPLIDFGAQVVLIVSGALVLAYNTGSISAMIKQYLEHKRRVYEPDIRHLDEKREREGKL